MPILTAGYPSISPATIALGTAYNHVSSFIISQPIFGTAFQKAREASTKEEFLKSKEAASAVHAFGASFVSSGFQSYAVSSLLKLTATVTYKGAAIVGSLLFAVSAGPSIVSAVVLEKKPLDVVIAQTVTSLLDTVGLALVLTWWDDNSILPID